MSYELIAAKREQLGTSASRRLRHAGKLPAVVYGANTEAVSVVLDHNPVYYALKEEGFHTGILNLVIDGEKQAVLLRDYQMHPYKQLVLHMDFQRVDLNEKMHVKVPLHFVGADASEAVKLQGAKISHVLTEVDVRALPAQLPSFIEVDLSAIQAGQTIHLSDLKLPEGVEITALVRGGDQAVASASGAAAAE
ncbi:50S ribosomal protein L25/general stress protein Ctc [Pseudogulbenkiania ferrooxidans]|uniref:Large ribosomal subunit protein bL25 n=1 Tax=Pseudogulbenkiania ferrooxidans 2002 TaxID=279714 RepID=B9YZ69_9NEIS|nr:50S ribosomal protein L25/general stress protein Ctc [Pseudogulbenkiania ferrooxidans]EEG10422.1 ribosomal 5S rRNA E-loop binding protein Ctc/L25/TL5 [Pseudogulbenkiania ferrooxidans 2002]